MGSLLLPITNQRLNHTPDSDTPPVPCDEHVSSPSTLLEVDAHDVIASMLPLCATTLSLTSEGSSSRQRVHSGGSSGGGCDVGGGALILRPVDWLRR